MEYYSAIKKNKFEPVVVKWMNLESLRVKQKEKNQYGMLTHIYGIQKNGTDEPTRQQTCGHSGGR